MPIDIADKPIPSLAKSPSMPLCDRLNRPLHDLRISVIDRCNFRCTYCMPESPDGNGYSFLKEGERLTFDEIERLSYLFVRLGASKIRLTGGEPLLRPGLDVLIGKMTKIPGITDLALTTNGSLLADQASALKSAGLKRITVSLDTLDPALFRRISGRRSELKAVLEGIEACEQAGFDCIKINVVLQKDINDHEILSLVRHFRNRKPILRFIEYMDVGNCNQWNAKAVYPCAQVVTLIHQHFPMAPAKPNYYGEVASRYQFLDGGGEVGFIPSVTQPFCRNCTRARLSTDGRIYTCLFAGMGLDLRNTLRDGASDDQMLDILRGIWQNRDDRYSEQRSQIRLNQNTSRKVEMFQIGG